MPPELRQAIEDLLLDIDSMQGPCACELDPCPHFSGFGSGDFHPDDGYSIEWVNLAISAENVREVMNNIGDNDADT